MQANQMPCRVDGCPRCASKSGYCWGHNRRAKLGLPVGGQLRPWRSKRGDVLRHAALAYAEAETDRDYELACARLRVAAVRYVRAVFKLSRR